jgi:hypothetical protein
MRRVIAGLALLMLAAPLAAQEPTPEAREHRVEPGETLWELAGRYLDDPHQWRVIYEANAERITDPHRLVPGMVLTIPARGPTQPAARITIQQAAQEEQPLGEPTTESQPRPRRAMEPEPRQAAEPEPQPRERARRAEERARPAEERARPAEERARPAEERETGLAFARRAGPPGGSPRDSDRTVFYEAAEPRPSEQRPTVLREPGIERYPVKPGEYASAPWIADPGELQVMGRFIRSLRTDPEVWGGPVWAHPEDRVFLGYVDDVRPERDTRLVVVEVGRRVPDAGAGQRIIHPRGVARVLSLNADAIEAQLEAQYGPILPGQLVLTSTPMPEQTAEMAEPVADGFDLEGRIIAFAEDRPLHGRADLAFVDLGRADGVQLGDVFMAFIPPREADVEREADRTLPPEPVAELRVVRVTDTTATVKVDRLSLPRLREELPVRRVQKMP